MSKTQYLRDAATKLDTAILKVHGAKQDLLHARSELHLRLAMALAEIEEIYEILTDPECTPEIAELEYVPDTYGEAIDVGHVIGRRAR